MWFHKKINFVRLLFLTLFLLMAGTISSLLLVTPDNVSAVPGPVHKINATIIITLPADNTKTDFGAYNITLTKVDINNPDNNEVVDTQLTDVKKAPDDVENNTITLHAVFDNVEEASYNVCLNDYGGSQEKCTAGEYNAGINGGITILTIRVAADKLDLLPANIDPNAPAPNSTTCAINGVGWIVCPVVRFLAGIADSSFKFLQNSFLDVKPELFNTSSSTYDGWAIMRNFANLAFVIAFLVIIFSQLTGFGITNYGVKKLLPRIIIAAILVNVSFFICQIAVDLSNIIGQSFSNLFINLGGGPPSGTARVTGWWGGNSYGDIAGIILATAVAGAAIWASLSALIPLLIMAVFALVMILFILVARQALIVLLIVISPLAFVAFLLPNTEKWYKNWQKMFVGLLMLYPIVGLVYGVSGFASRILSSKSVMGGSTLGEIAAASVAVLPLFLVPIILKKSLDGVGGIGSAINNLGNKAGRATGNKANKAVMDSDIVKHVQAKKANRIARQKTGNYRVKGGNYNPMNWRSGINRSMNSNRYFNKATGGFGAARVVAGQGQDSKDIGEAEALFRDDSDIARAWAADQGEMGDSYQKLTSTQQEQFRLLRSSGQHKKYTSFLAAAKKMSEAGKGTAEEFHNAMTAAEARGAQRRDTSNAKALAVSAYRKNGRASMAGTLNHDLLQEYDENVTRYNQEHAAEISADPKKALDYKNYNATTGREFTVGEQIAKEAANVAPSSVHRAELDDSDSTVGRDAYVANLELKRDNTRKAIAGYDSMEGRAKVKAEKLIIDAAAHHEYQRIYDEHIAQGISASAADSAATALSGEIKSMDAARAAFGFQNT